MIRLSSSADHVARIERDLDVFPLLIMFGLEHVVRLAAEDGALGAVPGGYEKHTAPAVEHFGRSGKRAVRLKLDSYLNDELLRIFCPGRNGPQLGQARAQSLKLAQRQLRCLPA